jgi:hypothetical protein
MTHFGGREHTFFIKNAEVPGCVARSERGDRNLAVEALHLLLQAYCNYMN